MFEAKLFHVEAVYEGIDEPYWILFVDILVDGVWEQHCLVSVWSVHMFAHGFSVVLKLALILTVSSEHRKRLFTQSEMGSEPTFKNQKIARFSLLLGH